jgi:hypothetical protein
VTFDGLEELKGRKGSRMEERNGYRMYWKIDKKGQSQERQDSRRKTITATSSSTDRLYSDVFNVIPITSKKSNFALSSRLDRSSLWVVCAVNEWFCQKIQLYDRIQLFSIQTWSRRADHPPSERPLDKLSQIPHNNSEPRRRTTAKNAGMFDSPGSSPICGIDICPSFLFRQSFSFSFDFCFTFSIHQSNSISSLLVVSLWCLMLRWSFLKWNDMDTPKCESKSKILILIQIMFCQKTSQIGI